MGYKIEEIVILCADPPPHSPVQQLFFSWCDPKSLPGVNNAFGTKFIDTDQLLHGYAVTLCDCVEGVSGTNYMIARSGLCILFLGRRFERRFGLVLLWLFS